MTTNVDFSEFIWDFLKTHADAATVRALLVDGADSVVESGDVSASLLKTRETTRRNSGEMGLALLLSVQDAGDEPDIPGHLLELVVIRVYDRFRGYRNIRAVRQAIKEALKGLPGNVGPLGTRGLLEVSYQGRVGHRFDLTFVVDYGAITYAGRVVELVPEN